MKVKELIEKLQQYNEDYTVEIDSSYGEYSPSEATRVKDGNTNRVVIDCW